MHPDVCKRPLFLSLLALIIGLVLFYKPTPTAQDIYHLIPQKDVTLIGRVEHFYTPKPASNNVIVKVLSVDGQPARGYVYARLKDNTPLWKDTLEIQGRLQEPYGIDLIGNFNWRKYLSYKRVFTEIKSDHVQIVQTAPWPYRILRAIRGDILHTFQATLPASLAPIASGILLGERDELSPDLFTAFQDSGAIHLLVASGANVGFVTLITLAFCGMLGFNRRKALWVALLIAGIYTLVAGADAPLLRAYFMTLCACAGYYLGRNSGVLQGLILSCFIILVFFPASLFETGFQMSFLATAALIICLNNYPIPTRWPKWIRFFAQIFLVTLAVQLVLLPIFTNTFYKVSLTGLIANVVLVPLASLLLALSFIYYLCTCLHIGVVAYYPVVYGLIIFKQLVLFFASFSFAALPVTAWGTGTVCAYYIGFWGVLQAPVSQGRQLRKWFVLIGIVGSVIFGYLFASQTRIYLLDEWYKDMALVKIKHGPVFIVGEGLDPIKIQNALYKLGYRQADALFLTRSRESKFEYDTIAAQVIRPFENNWPEETYWTFGKTSVKLIWGLHQTKEGHVWHNRGYTGSNKDDVSYCFVVSHQPSFCIGAGARFVDLPDKTIQPLLNQTVEVKL